MNLTLFVHSGIWEPLESLVRWCFARRPPTTPASHTPLRSPGVAPKFVASSALLTGATGQMLVDRKPLRVVRVVEAGQARAGVGRMVISGRMADVCAELDRLAAREAALLS